MPADQQHDLERVIDDIFDGAIPESELTTDYYDRVTTLFLKRINGSPHQQKHQWSVMRVGLRTLINQRRSAARSDIKAGDDRRVADRSRRENAKLRHNYIRRHNLDPQDPGAVSSHMLLQAVKQYEAAVDEEATRKAAAIMDGWIIDGRLKLGDCTGSQLLAFAEKERALASGHQKNADFYAALGTHIGPTEKLRDAISTSALIAAHASFNSERTADAA